MKAAFENIFVKISFIVILILLLIVPTFMVERLIIERNDRQKESIQEVSDKHARAQQVSGPVLTIPYAIPREDGKGNRETGNFHVLPEQLNISGELNPEKRKRGMYETVVYGSSIHVDGVFDNIDVRSSSLKPEHLQLSKAYLTIGVSDLKGVTKQVSIKMNDSSYQFQPGVLSSEVIYEGLHTSCKLDSIVDKQEFEFDLELNGTEFLRFMPIGKETSVNLSSSWEDPSFSGNFLPTKRKIGKDGFQAEWNVLSMNRNFPQSWTNNRYSINNSSFGVDLDLGVDVYQKTMRVAKYAILFVALTFLVFFFVEIMNRILIHPIQYTLVGISLVVFYVLLLAFSEQIDFGLAYLIAAGMTISLVCLYAKNLLKSWSLVGVLGLILTILYVFIFIIIQMQDYALLFGSIGIFLILAITMFFSRKIDWFQADQKKTIAAYEANE
ncbi:MAG: cell envelope integrity protein CreD [Crocinitomicaceae bacterium]|nr:cell envelope integrity protein CreD [Crocinitomicaceae bacterium]